MEQVATEEYVYPGNGQPRTDEMPVAEHKQSRVMRQMLAEVAEIVTGPRQKAYGLPQTNHGRTARMWSEFLGVEITPRQVNYMNILQKCSREANGPHLDNDVDVAGFAANARACWDE